MLISYFADFMRHQSSRGVAGKILANEWKPTDVHMFMRSY